MIQHIVLIKPRDGVEPAAMTRLVDALAALPGTIPGITGYTWGTNASPEGLNRGYTHGFVMTFEDAAARDAYLPHPDHTAIGPLMQPVAEEVLVFDLEM